NDRSIYYGSGHLVPASHGIERTFSWLLSTLVSCLTSNTKPNDCLTRIFWTTTCIFWTAICGFVLWDRNQSVYRLSKKLMRSSQHRFCCLKKCTWTVWRGLRPHPH